MILSDTVALNDHSSGFNTPRLEQLIHHPEYNYTLILQSETLCEIFEILTTLPRAPGALGSHRPIYILHRKLLPPIGDQVCRSGPGATMHPYTYPFTTTHHARSC